MKQPYSGMWISLRAQKRSELALELKNIFLSEKRQVPYRYSSYDNFYVKTKQKALTENNQYFLWGYVYGDKCLI